MTDNSNAGLAAAEERVRNQDRTAKMYTDMSNGAPMQSAFSKQVGGSPHNMTQNGRRQNMTGGTSPQNIQPVNIPKGQFTANIGDTNGQTSAPPPGETPRYDGQQSPKENAPSPAAPMPSLLQSFGIDLNGIDRDRLIIGALIVLLASEGADWVLIAALVYIMS